MIDYSKKRKPKPPPPKAPTARAEAKESPDDEARESAAMRKLESRMGFDKRKGAK
jgi:hypothetical protein